MKLKQQQYEQAKRNWEKRHMCTCTEKKTNKIDFNKPIQIVNINYVDAIADGEYVGKSNVLTCTPHLIVSKFTKTVYACSETGEVRDFGMYKVRNVQQKVKKITMTLRAHNGNINAVTKNAEELRHLSVGDIYGQNNTVIHLSEFEIVV
jgi:hypothetical protein